MIKYYAHIKNGKSAEISPVSSDSTVVIGVSVGSDTHENGKLQATLECLKQKGFKKFVFVIADTLQRHTLSLSNPSLTPDVLANLADHLGDQWIARNKDSIREVIGTHYEIVKWKDILAMGCFKEWEAKLKGTDTEFHMPEGFDEAVEKTSQQFIERYKRQYLSNIPSDTVLKECAIKYITEECAGLIGFGLSRKFEYFAYPSQIISAFAFVQENFLTFKDESTTYLEYIPIGIKPVKPSHDSAVHLVTSQSAMFARRPPVVDEQNSARTRAAFEGMTTAFLTSGVGVARTQEFFLGLLCGSTGHIIDEIHGDADTPTSTSTGETRAPTPVLS